MRVIVATLALVAAAAAFTDIGMIGDLRLPDQPFNAPGQDVRGGTYMPIQNTRIQEPFIRCPHMEVSGKFQVSMSSYRRECIISMQAYVLFKSKEISLVTLDAERVPFDTEKRACLITLSEEHHLIYRFQPNIDGTSSDQHYLSTTMWDEHQCVITPDNSDRLDVLDESEDAEASSDYEWALNFGSESRPFGPVEVKQIKTGQFRVTGFMLVETDIGGNERFNPDNNEFLDHDDGLRVHRLVKFSSVTDIDDSYDPGALQEDLDVDYDFYQPYKARETFLEADGPPVHFELVFFNANSGSYPTFDGELVSDVTSFMEFDMLGANGDHLYRKVPGSEQPVSPFELNEIDPWFGGKKMRYNPPDGGPMEARKRRRRRRRRQQQRRRKRFRLQSSFATPAPPTPPPP